MGVLPHPSAMAFKPPKKKVVRESAPSSIKPKTKKAKAIAEAWKGPDRSKLVRSSLAEKLKDFGVERFGRSTVAVGDKIKEVMVGIPAPFPIQYIIGREGLPLSIAISVDGEKGSRKTTLILEILRWVFSRDGYAAFLNNEGKFNAELAEGVFQKPLDDVSFIYNNCQTQEDWQQRFLRYLKQSQKDLMGTADEPGPGRTIPFAVCVDGLTSVSSVETIESINREGFAGRGYAIEANNNTKYFNAVLPLIRDWPFLVLIGNHRKIKQDKHGNEASYTPGGTVVGFLQAINLTMEFSGRLERTAKFNVAKVRIGVSKNSLEADDRSILARVLYWKKRAEDGTVRQMVKWDWGWTTVQLLTSEFVAKRLKAAGFHLEALTNSTVDNLCWSKTLKVPRDKPISWAAMGERIEKSPKILAELRRLLDIAPLTMLEGDYIAQMKGIEEENQQVMDERNSSAEAGEESEDESGDDE